MPQRFGRPGLLGTIARTAVISGTATAVSNRVERRDMRRQGVAQPPQTPAAAPPPPAPAPAPAPAGTDRVSQLTQLAELKAQGLLTDEEFATEKARILGS
ncbi:SHOCT domain-containing protein [Streptomyces cyaneofuscatus]